ncbi:thermonuclease family protein [Mobilicoccus caccae]|uniref:thermonuclease family protein n=1 Tax=Mobilicoccus caccae TaxID=1859295 RepID=UPI0024E0E202|nr:thermonuclease family protein [Mobilicoccus caccae]
MSIVDGDTIRVRIDGRTERVRVIGIDTPELSGDECYARQASSKMQSLAQSRSVRLEADPTQDDRDRYDRLLRHVFLADGRSAAEVLIAGGFGREYTYAADYRYQDQHRAAEVTARSTSKGMWGSGCADGQVGGNDGGRKQGGSTPKPAPRVTEKAPAPAAGSCSIKGNINDEGERIYHVPGGRSYDKTKITESKGEKWFCSESEARAAGWRAARG